MGFLVERGNLYYRVYVLIIIIEWGNIFSHRLNAQRVRDMFVKKKKQIKVQRLPASALNPSHDRPTHLLHPGSPHPIPTSKYSRNTITTPSKTINLTFFHHILLRKPVDLTLKSLALPPNRSVLSTKRSIRSPRSNTRSIFSVMIPLTLSISLWTFAKASFWPAFVVP